MEYGELCKHKVKNIDELDPVDDKEMIEIMGFKFVGICVNCGERILAKDKREYNLY